MERLSRIDMIINMLKSEPNDLFLNYTLGLEYVAELSLQDAEFQFKKTLEINVDYIPAFYQLGKLFESQLKNTEALHYFKLGLEQAKSQKNNKAINEFSEAVFMLED
jgi:tetratricopeptide (TPR) repeat protein